MQLIPGVACGGKPCEGKYWKGGGVEVPDVRGALGSKMGGWMNRDKRSGSKNLEE